MPTVYEVLISFGKFSDKQSTDNAFKYLHMEDKPDIDITQD
jgi:hypothetical protein